MGKYENIIDHKFKSITSFSHMLGCITALVVDYIRSAYNDEYFKTIRCTTEVPYAERGKWYRDIFQKTRPIMIIEPRFDPSDESRFLPSSEFDAEIPNDPATNIWIGANHGTPLILDNKYHLLYKGSRYKIVFNITFIFDSDVQRMQSQEFIRQNIRHRMPIVINRYVENNIPSHFMQAISHISNIDINSEEFMSYINKISKVPITHRIRTGSGNKEFFCMSPTSLNLTFQALPSANGAVKKGNIIVSSSFSEEIEVEFPANSMYFLRTSVDVGSKIDMGVNNILQEIGMKSVATQKLAIAEFPVFNDLENGYKKILQLTVQSDTNEDDTLNIDNQVNGEIRRILSHYRTHKMNIDFLRLAVCEGTKRLDGSRVEFDPNTLDVRIKNIDMYRVYHIALYVNNEFVNNLKQSIFAFDKYEEIIKK